MTEIAAAGRVLAAAAPAALIQSDVLTVVIEGDGRSHDRRGRAAEDPTPAAAVGLQIARRWPANTVVWLGRLCQYVRERDRRCRTEDWTTARFSPEAVAAANAAIDQLKVRAGAGRVRLVGWSGGGVIAALAAMERKDVDGLVTIAAPLDLQAWTRWHGLTPLDGSRDPAAGRFARPTPQVHLSGAFDPVVPPAVTTPAARRLAGDAGVVATWPERHQCCWARRTREIAALIGR